MKRVEWLRVKDAFIKCISNSLEKTRKVKTLRWPKATDGLNGEIIEVNVFLSLAIVSNYRRFAFGVTNERQDFEMKWNSNLILKMFHWLHEARCNPSKMKRVYLHLVTAMGTFVHLKLNRTNGHDWTMDETVWKRVAPIDDNLHRKLQKFHLMLIGIRQKLIRLNCKTMGLPEWIPNSKSMENVIGVNEK